MQFLMMIDFFIKSMFISNFLDFFFVETPIFSLFLSFFFRVSWFSWLFGNPVWQIFLCNWNFDTFHVKNLKFQDYKWFCPKLQVFFKKFLQFQVFFCLNCQILGFYRIPGLIATVIYPSNKNRVCELNLKTHILQFKKKIKIDKA